MTSLRMKIILVFLLVPAFGFAQGFGDYISENAKQINNDYTLDSTHYERFKNHSLIMVGEMHGTQEPATLVKAISQLLLHLCSFPNEGSFSEATHDILLMSLFGERIRRTSYEI